MKFSIAEHETSGAPFEVSHCRAESLRWDDPARPLRQESAVFFGNTRDKRRTKSASDFCEIAITRVDVRSGDAGIFFKFLFFKFLSFDFLSVEFERESRRLVAVLGHDSVADRDDLLCATALKCKMAWGRRESEVVCEMSKFLGRSSRSFKSEDMEELLDKNLPSIRRRILCSACGSRVQSIRRACGNRRCASYR